MAQSLGTPAADLWIGQPLKMTIPARFVPGDSGGECVHADVFYGDNRVGAGNVRATVVGPEDSRRVRIEADVPIDEPIVTVSLRAGCRNSVTRSYTLLPDIPSEAVLAALMRPQAPALVTAGAAATPLRLATAAAAPAPRLRATRAVRPEAAVARASDTAPIPIRTTAPVFRKNLSSPGARLRLEPIDTDAHAMLRVTASLAEPQGDAARRATAALLWQAINADPQDLLRTSAMLQKLEADLTQLRQATGAARSEVAALRRRLDEPQPWYASPIASQLLVLLVLAAAGAAGMLWYRTRGLVATPQPWYQRESTGPEPFAMQAAVVAPQQPAPQPAAQPQERRADPVSTPAVASAPKAIPAAGLAGAVASAGPASGAMDVEVRELPPRRPATGVLRVETLAATFEEVEFLSSLGLAGDAMDVLKTYLQDSCSPAPLAYFELMRMCEQAGDPQAIATVRRRYAKVFGAQAPSLEQVTAPVGLEAVDSLSARITRAWGTSEALDLIEQALFELPPPNVTLTLQAGRELICLHDVAMNLLGDGATGSASGLDAESHPVAPWANSDDPGAALALAQAMADADERQFAVDVDLNAAPEPLPQPEDIPPELELELAPLISEMQAAAERDAAARAAARAQKEAEDAFSAAVALERAPASRY